MLIVYGLVDNSSIGRLYAGAIMPGLLLLALFIGYVTLRCFINPKLGPPVPKEERLPLSGRLKLMGRIVAPAILIFLVLGTIFTGVAAPTEAAGVGAAGAIVLTALQGKLKWRGVVQAAENTLKSSAMVMWTIFGANIFVGLYVMVGGGRFVTELLLGSGLSKWGIIIVMQFILIFLGCFIDWVGINYAVRAYFRPYYSTIGL